MRSILIIDDRENWLDILIDLLEECDLKIDHAKDFKTAKDKLNSNNYDLMITDLKLQADSLDETIFNKKEGIELLRIAKSINKYIRTILITAYPKDIDIFIQNQLEKTNEEKEYDAVLDKRSIIKDSDCFINLVNKVMQE